IYDDLEALRLFGLDIVSTRGRGCGYYIASRDFELPELKLLVDSVQSSKFITEKKTLSLIRKIENLASVYDAQLLHRQVYVRNRVKSMNESVYYNVDSISGAINADHRIRFRYYEYTADKVRQFRHNGAVYEISPFALIWDDENYYMLGWDEAAGKMKHFRVDKMEGIVEAEELRQGKAAFAQVDMAAYSRKVFGMFTGEEETVRLRFARHLAGAVIDRFGKDVTLLPEGEEHFTVSVAVALSPKFYAWVFGFGTAVEILSPPAARDAIRDMLGDVLACYQ
ncbi:MAG: WYL domain-containing protein, partial [Oscillospiraceae bacterium]|nr:WYL domain-containing protein [Oscillospiraceae bacterium]